LNFRFLQHGLRSISTNFHAEMKAIVNTGEDLPKGQRPPSVLKVGEVFRPFPSTQAGEVLIKVHATAVNRAEIMQRQGKYPPSPGVSPIIGLECAGEIVDPVSLEPTGQRVMALLPGGGYSQYVKVLKSHTMPLFSESMTWEEAAGIPEVWCTAYQLLHLVAKIKEGDTALIHAAASGVGTTMLQLCKTARVRTIAVTSSDLKLQICKSLGADAGVNYKADAEWSKQVLDLTQGRGVDLITDPVLGSHFN
jgi:tumor protein p53-inducible protein 3